MNDDRIPPETTAGRPQIILDPAARDPRSSAGPGNLAARLRAAETRLRQSEARFRALAEASSDFVFRASGDWMEVRRLRGADHAAETSEPSSAWLDRYCLPDDRPRIVEAVKAALRSRKAFEVEHRVRRSDGSIGWVLSRAAPVADEQGQIVEWFGSTLDITKRTAAEEALRESTARERAFLEHLPVGIWFLDATGRITYGNPAGRRIWEGARYIGPEDFAEYKGWWHGSDRRVAAEDWGAARAIRKGETSINELIDIECFDGSRKTMLNSAVPVRDAAGRIVGAVVINQDVTDRIRTEQELARITGILRAVIDNTPDLVFAKDIEGRLLVANPAVCKLIAKSEKELLGRNDLEWGGDTPETRLIVEIDRRVMRERRTEVAEEPFTGADGKRRVFLSAKACWFDENGSVKGLVGISRDITDRKQAEEELEGIVRERTARLQETIGELEAFSYSIAHDMRAPLRAMTGFAQVLVEDYSAHLDAAGRDLLGRIAASASRMDDLIEDVLNYSRVSRAQADIVSVDCDRLVRDILQSYPSFQPPRATVRVKGTLAHARGFVAGLTQCFANLIGNAVKFVPPGAHPKVQLWSERNGSMIRFWIEDNGIGIAPEHQPKLFQMFQRLHAAGEFEGTGIGLAIVRRAVDRMNGRVGVESQPGNGSRFWFEIPAEESSPNTPVMSS